MLTMNRIRLIIIIFLLIPSTSIFAQNINTNELVPFVLLEKNEYEKALVALDQLIKENPKQQFQLAKIEALYKLNRHQEAISLCKKMDQERSASSSIYKIKIYNKLGDDENLQLALNENLNSKCKVLLYDLLNKEEFIDVKSSILLKADAYSIVEKQLYQIKMLIHSNNYTEALFIVDEVISRNPNNAKAYFLQSKISYFLGDYRKSKYAISQAINIERSNPDFIKQKVKVSIKLENYSEALENANRLIRKDPYGVENYILKLNILVLNDMFDEGIELSNKLLELIPENEEVLLLNSNSYFKVGDNLSALKSVSKALEIRQAKQAFELRGDIYMATSTYKFAVSDYSMYLDIEPYNGEVYLKKGLARLELGDQKGACSDWSKAKRYGCYKAVRYLEKYCK